MSTAYGGDLFNGAGDVDAPPQHENFRKRQTRDPRRVLTSDKEAKRYSSIVAARIQ